jgi:hypothetical protein
MTKKISIAMLAVLVALLASVFASGSASAHEVRTVGKYSFVVGWLEEPAYAGLKNGLDLTICDGACAYTTKDGQRVLSNPVLDADKTLKAEVIMGSAAPLALPLEGVWSNPGKYASYFEPSKAGDYTFHISGTLNGQNIDEKFTSGKGFEGVDTIQNYPAGSQQSQNSAEVTALQNQLKDAQNSASNAITIGLVGGALGLIGLVVAVAAIWRKPAAAQTQEETREKAESLRG